MLPCPMVELNVANDSCISMIRCQLMHHIVFLEGMSYPVVVIIIEAQLTLYLCLIETGRSGLIVTPEIYCYLQRFTYRQRNNIYTLL